jgi:hypothetical protein
MQTLVFGKIRLGTLSNSAVKNADNTEVGSLGPTWFKKRTGSHKLSSDFDLHEVARHPKRGMHKSK